MSALEQAGSRACRTQEAPYSDAAPGGARGELRLAFAGGGTGGHVLPGRHLLAHLVARGALADLCWLGTGRRAEERGLAGLAAAVAPATCAHVRLSLEREGHGAPSRAALLWRTPPAFLRARAALSRHRSEVLLGLGGFGSLPGVLAARSLALPVVLLEVNATAGAATRRLARFAELVVHAFPASVPPDGADPGNGRLRHAHLGPPLPPGAFASRSPAERAASARGLGFAPERPLLVVLGGSQGASALNACLRAGAAALSADGVQVLHQVGPGRAAEAAPPAPGYRAVEYLDDVRAALDAATLVLSRGGAATLAELAAARAPALIVPYPHHADRHQERNARALGGGVELLAEPELEGAGLARIRSLLSPAGAARRAELAAALAAALPRDGAERLAAELERLALRTRATRAGLGLERGRAGC